MALAFAMAGVAVGPAANAATPTFTVSDAPYVSGGCTAPAYAYDAAPPAGYSDVDVTLSVYTPGGTDVLDVFRNGATGQGTFNLCNASPGAYRATMDVFACTSTASDCQSYAGPTAYFYIGDRTPPQTQYLTAKFTASAHATTPDQFVKFRVRAKYGRASMSSADAFLQQKLSGRWVKVRGSEHSLNTNGRSVWSYRVPGSRLQVRARVSMFDEVVFTKPVTLT